MATGSAAGSDLLENRTFDELNIGDSASVSHRVTFDDIHLFAAVSGDVNPAHVDPLYAKTDPFHRVIMHGMWGGALISSVLGVKLPGPGTIYLDQSLSFKQPVAIGDTITATVTVGEKKPEHGIVVLSCRCVNQRGDVVISGEAVVKAPTQKVRWPRVALPQVCLTRPHGFSVLVDQAKKGQPIPTAIVHPCDVGAMGAMAAAAAAGLIVPILVGPDAKIRSAARAAGITIEGYRLVDAPHSHAAAAEGVSLVRSGAAAMIMKGSLHTDELMAAVVAADGLRTERRISHVFVMDAPAYPRPLLITDAAVNIAPDMDAKRDIVQNAIDLAHVLGIALPKVAILAAVETVNPRMRTTMEAAALCKMADRGQITGGVIDGPLALDNAVSPAAAAEKNILSTVAGQADILVVPDLEAGNMLAKQLTFLGGAEAAGVVLGARVPLILSSRADSPASRLASCAVAVLLARSRTGIETSRASSTSA